VKIQENKQNIRHTFILRQIFRSVTNWFLRLRMFCGVRAYILCLHSRWSRICTRDSRIGK